MFDIEAYVWELRENERTTNENYIEITQIAHSTDIKRNNKLSFPVKKYFL
jgi:hypothetical protein